MQDSTFATRTVYREFFEGMRPEGVPFSEDELRDWAKAHVEDVYSYSPQAMSFAMSLIRAADFAEIAEALNAHLID